MKNEWRIYLGETAGGREISLVMDARIEVAGIGALDCPERGEATSKQVADGLAKWILRKVALATESGNAAMWIAEQLALAVSPAGQNDPQCPSPGLAGGQKASGAVPACDEGVELWWAVITPRGMICQRSLSPNRTCAIRKYLCMPLNSPGGVDMPEQTRDWRRSKRRGYILARVRVIPERGQG